MRRYPITPCPAILKSATDRLMEKYPEHIVEYVRQNLGLESADPSRDDDILNMSRNEVLDRVATWNGLISYGDTIREWVESVYGIELEDKDNEQTASRFCSYRL